MNLRERYIELAAAAEQAKKTPSSYDPQTYRLIATGTLALLDLASSLYAENEKLRAENEALKAKPQAQMDRIHDFSLQSIGD